MIRTACARLSLGWDVAANAIKFCVNSLPTAGTVDSRSSPLHLMNKAVVLSKGCGRYAILSTTTSSSDGTSVPRSRMINPSEVQLEDGSPVIYFHTNRLSRKFKELKANCRVTLAFMNQLNLSYVCFEGEAKQVAYPQSTKHWREALWVLYPEGPDEAQGSRFTVWRFTPHKIQMQCITEGILTEERNWQPPELERVANGEWQISSHGR